MIKPQSLKNADKKKKTVDFMKSVEQSKNLKNRRVLTLPVVNNKESQ